MISNEETKRLSKLLSYVLRHNPSHLDIRLDENGWIDVGILIKQLNVHEENMDFHMLAYIVETNDKKRFSFNDDLTLIRASQGHSLEIELNYSSQIPPTILFHGTAEKNIAAIKESGLLKMNRHHVHLSANKETAFRVGQRHGKPVILSVQAMKMHENEHLFYLSDNDVWLTDNVPAEFIIETWQNFSDYQVLYK